MVREMRFYGFAQSRAESGIRAHFASLSEGCSIEWPVVGVAQKSPIHQLVEMVMNIHATHKEIPGVAIRIYGPKEDRPNG